MALQGQEQHFAAMDGVTPPKGEGVRNTITMHLKITIIYTSVFSVYIFRYIQYSIYYVYICIHSCVLIFGRGSCQ